MNEVYTKYKVNKVPKDYMDNTMFDIAEKYKIHLIAETDKHIKQFLDNFFHIDLDITSIREVEAIHKRIDDLGLRLVVETNHPKLKDFSMTDFKTSMTTISTIKFLPKEE